MANPIAAVEEVESKEVSFLYKILNAVSGNIDALTQYQVAQAETVSTLSTHSTLVTKRHNDDLKWWYDNEMVDHAENKDEAQQFSAAQSVYNQIDAEWQGMETVATGMISKAESGLDMLSSAISSSTTFVDTLNGIMANLKNQRIST